MTKFKELYTKNETAIKNIAQINTILEALYIEEAEEKIGGGKLKTSKSVDDIASETGVKFSRRFKDDVIKTTYKSIPDSILDGEYETSTADEYKTAEKRIALPLVRFKTGKGYQTIQFPNMDSRKTDELVMLPSFDGIGEIMSNKALGIVRDGTVYKMPAKNALELIKACAAKGLIKTKQYFLTSNGVAYNVMVNSDDPRSDAGVIFDSMEKINSAIDQAVDKQNINYVIYSADKEVLIGLGFLFDPDSIKSKLEIIGNEYDEEVDSTPAYELDGRVAKAMTPFEDAVSRGTDLDQNVIKKIMPLIKTRFTIKMLISVMDTIARGYKFYSEVCANNIKTPYVIMESIERGGLKEILSSQAEEGDKVSTIDLVLSSLPADKFLEQIKTGKLVSKTEKTDGYTQIVVDEKVVGIFYAITVKVSEKSQIGRAAKLFKNLSTDVKSDLEKFKESIDYSLVNYDSLIVEGVFDKLTDKAKTAFTAVKGVGKKIFDMLANLKLGLKKSLQTTVPSLEANAEKALRSLAISLNESAETEYKNIMDAYFAMSVPERIALYKKVNANINLGVNRILQKKGKVFVTNIETHDSNPAGLSDLKMTELLYSYSYINAIAAYIVDEKTYNSKSGDLRQMIHNIVELYIEASFGKSAEVPLWRIMESGEPYTYLGTRSQHKEQVKEKISKHVRVDTEIPLLALHSNYNLLHYLNLYSLVDLEMTPEGLKPKYARIRFGVDKATFAIDIAVDGIVNDDDTKLIELGIGKAKPKKAKK